MADDRMAVLETLRKAERRRRRRLPARGRPGPRPGGHGGRGERAHRGRPRASATPERRLTHRNGYRERRWDTRVGTIDLAIPRVRDGSYLPSLLDPRRRTERALLAVVQEAYVPGVSTRRVDDLVRALGIEGISRSEVSRICAALDAEVEAFRRRPLGEAAYPYLWLDATYLKVREGGRVVSMAALVAIGVRDDRRAPDPGPRAQPRATTRAAPGRPSSGASSSAACAASGSSSATTTPGLVKAVHEQLLGSAWQRCRVHFTRNAQDLVPRSARSMVASAIRSVFEQPDGASAREQLDRVIDGMARPYPRVAELLTDAEPDLLAHFAFPETHRRQIRSTNPLERLNKEIKRRTAVVGIFPNRASVIRLVGMILAEQDDEWQDGRRYFRPETMAAIDAVAQSRRWASRCCSRAETSDARTTRCYTTSWDLTGRSRARRLMTPSSGEIGRRVAIVRIQLGAPTGYRLSDRSTRSSPSRPTGGRTVLLPGPRRGRRSPPSRSRMWPVAARQAEEQRQEGRSTITHTLRG